MRTGWKYWGAVLGILVVFAAGIQGIIRERAQASVLKADSCEGEKFREQYLPENVYEDICRTAQEKKKSFEEILTITMLNGKFFPESASSAGEVFRKYKKEAFFTLMESYAAVWSDIQCFPLAGNEFFYEDTFGESRDFGGERFHEGTDIFGKEEISGYYPVLSMTDGVVEKIGWLPLGGYRIGIRAPHGAYFYYAHFAEYEKSFQVGEKVEAGDILGYMGNTGYGPEGTVGKFPVHLHLGIYIRTLQYEELSVNPYWILQDNEKKLRKYVY